MTSMTWGRRLLVIGTVIAMGIGVATTAYGSSSSNGSFSSKGSSSSTINISDEYGVTWNCQFNPYNGSDEFDSFGPVYEELVYVDSLKNGATTPWLATAWAWSNNDKTLTFTIRNGVKWSDGQPFSAKDVLFTFNLLKKYPALDLNCGLVGAEQRVRQGIEPGRLQLQDSRGAVLLLHRRRDADRAQAHLVDRSRTRSPTSTRTRSAPGRTLLSSCSGANIQYKKNPNYWQPGLPADRDGQLPVLPVEQRGQRGPEERHRPVGLAVHPEHQGLLPVEEPESTTTGSSPSTTSTSAST